MNASQARYEPAGWTHWPDHHDFSFNFARVLGAAQEGGSTISECFLTASRIEPGDEESWHREWCRTADASRARAESASADNHPQTAKVNWLRAANYYRAAEFFLDHDDPRRLATFDQVEGCTHRYLALLEPAGEIVQIPFETSFLDAYFIQAPGAVGRQPVVICFGGLDEYKDELVHEMPRHAFPRGLSLLLVDLPGQGGSLRRRGLRLRPDTEAPIGRCIDYLQGRSDVDPDRIAVYGASLGGYFAPRAASYDHRIACVVSDGAVWNGLSREDLMRAGYERMRGSIVWRHLLWVTGQPDLDRTIEYLRDARLEGRAEGIRCPYLITHGECDFAGLGVARTSYEYLKARGVDVTLRIFTAEETGAAHCQIDNPSLGQEFICDWIADRLGIDQRSLRRSTSAESL